jgi:DNA-binding response OmpR family regulator
MTILIVAGEKQLAKTIQQHLQREDCRCEIAPDLEQGRQFIDQFNYDCILLDTKLPDGDGLDLLKTLKAGKRKDGVIMMSAKDSLEEKITALKGGADDFLIRPFHPAELSARAEAIMRRRFLQGDSEITFKNLQLDTLARTCTIDGTAVSLTKTEYDLLLLLLIHKDQVISKNAIAAHLTGQQAAFLDNFDTLYAHIKNLKRKLREAGEYIQTIYGVGYKFGE